MVIFKPNQNDIIGVHRPAESRGRLARLAELWPIFSLVVAYTATVQLPGLSGAGTSPELRELTAAADAEILYYGRARCLPGGVPSNPTGAPGPSIITRAAFNLLPAMPYVCIDAGLKVAADVPGLVKLDGAMPSEAVNTGHALPLEVVTRLFAAGLEVGQGLAQRFDAKNYLIIAESVPGGTTTALGLLMGLGVDAEQRVSSSMPDNAHNSKLAAVLAGLAAAGATKGTFSSEPLAAVAAVGDPMQAAVAGIAIAASKYMPVVLGGGTQMAAVLALMAALRVVPPPAFAKLISQAQPTNLALATTRWVWADPTADLMGLAVAIESRFGTLAVPYLAANLDFSTSRYAPLRLYEQGYVKEGVGAGAAAMAAIINGPYHAQALLPSIERVYEDLVLAPNQTL